jgi:transcription termination/antitermination protein NusG
MPEDRNRPQPGKPDAATLAQQLFRDEPEPADEPEPQPALPEAPPSGAADSSGSSVGVLVPPGEVSGTDEAGAAAGTVQEDGSRTQTAPVTAEGTVELPPDVQAPGVEAVSPEDEAARAARGARWYVIHTYSGYENKVRTNLERRIASMGQADKIFRILVPTEDEIEIKDGKRRIAKKKVFPGYVLVEMIMDDDSWYVVRNTPGVTGFVGSGAKPLPLQDREVKSILKQLGDETPKFRITYQKGSAVRINSGPFMDFSGVVDEILPEKEKVRVLVSIFGRETPVELDFAQVEKI